MAVDDLYRVRYRFAASGVNWRTFLYYRVTLQPSGPETTQAIALGIHDHLTPKIEAVMDQQAVVSNLTVYRISPHGNHVGYIPLVFSEGGLIGIRLPGAVSALMHLNQATRSARCNGRIMVSGLNIAEQTSGYIPNFLRQPGQALGDLAAALEAPVPLLSGTELAMVVMSRSSPPFDTPYGDPLSVTSVVCDPRTHAARKRSSVLNGMGPILESGPI